MLSADLVLAIPELLERILLRLQERDLLLSQGGNTTWRRVTKTSPHLQPKVFYKADVHYFASMYDTNWNPLGSILE